MTAEDAHIEETRDGLRLHIDHKATDTLIVIDLKHSGQTLWAKIGLRGNFDVRQRPMRWMSTWLDSPLVPESVRLQRKADALRRVGR